MDHDHHKGLGVNSNSTKAEMEQKCREKGMAVSKNDTKGSLLRKLRSAQEFEVMGSEETIVGFGRHADKKYKEDPQTYLDWVMEVFHENPTDCSGKLARLAAWAKTQQTKSGDTMDEKNSELMASSLFCGVPSWSVGGTRAQPQEAGDRGGRGRGEQRRPARRDDGADDGTTAGRNAAAPDPPDRARAEATDEPGRGHAEGAHALTGELQNGLPVAGPPGLASLRPLARQEVAFLVGQSRSTDTPGVEALLAEGRVNFVDL